MISSTLGAPLGGTTFGGQPGLESAALRLIWPAKGGGGFGMYLPSMVVVALGEPGVPVVWIYALAESHGPPNTDSRAAFAVDRNNCRRFSFIWSPHFVLFVSCAAHSGNRCGWLSCQLLAESAPRACSAGNNWARRDTSRP